MPNSNNSILEYNFPAGSVTLDDTYLALESLTMYYSTFNITVANNNNFVQYRWIDNVVYDVTFPDGFYSATDIQNYIRSVMLTNKHYLLDLAGLTVWKDGKLDNEESYFLFKVAETLKLSDAITQESIDSISQFIEKYKSEIQYFNYSNPVKHFYEHSTSSVELLIKRNKKRLSKEIVESKELMQLLLQSTQRELDTTEKKKVKKQLLDICKSVPSLTIFLLPGGSLLLPLLIKFIPQILPSAFNENLED